MIGEAMVPAQCSAAQFLKLLWRPCKNMGTVYAVILNRSLKKKIFNCKEVPNKDGGSNAHIYFHSIPKPH